MHHLFLEGSPSAAQDEGDDVDVSGHDGDDGEEEMEPLGFQRF